jgi:hypothetical protein
LVAAGVLAAPPTVTRSLPGATPATQVIFDGLCELLALRSLYDKSQTGTPYSWEFIRHWCGIGSDGTVDVALKWLIANRYVVKVEPGDFGGSAVRKVRLLDLGPGPSATESPFASL